jgi:hypothetical protein
MRRLLTGALLAFVVTAASGLVGWTTAASAETPSITIQQDKFSVVDHFDACGGAPANTEYFSGIEHLVIVREGDDIHVDYTIAFHVFEVYDDPSIPTRERRGEDAISFQLVNNGAAVIQHESFHDLNSDFGDIFLITTFHAVNGEVLVDQVLSRNLPPAGC